MFNLGLPEILVIGAAALLVFGPKRLPELAKSLGKGIRDFKKALEGQGEPENEPTPETPKKETLAQGDPRTVAQGSPTHDSAHDPIHEPSKKS